MSFVQEVGGNNAGGATTCVATMTSVAGDLLVVCIAMATGATVSVSSVTDDGGNTYHAMPTGNPMYVSGHVNRGELWYSIAANANATGVTVTFSASVAAVISVQEHSGSWAIDVSAGTAGDSSSASSGATATLAGNSDLAIGFVCAHNTGTYSSTGSGYTATTEHTNTPEGILSAYKYSASSGGETYTATLPASVYWACGVCCFKSSAAAAVKPVRPRVVGQAVQRSAVW